MTTPDPTAEPFSTYTFTDADGDVLSIGRAVFPAGGTPSVSISTPTGEPVHVPHADVPAVIVALNHAAGITPAPADVTVYELRTDTLDGGYDHVATYAVINAAVHHGEHQYHTAHGTSARLKWRPTSTPDTVARWRLTAMEDGGTETETDWHIVPGMIPVNFTPGCGES